MNPLTIRLLDPETLPQLVTDGAALVDHEVRRQKGLGGLAVKTGYKTFKAIMPNIVEKAVAFLIHKFIPVIERYHADFQAGRSPEMTFKDYLIQHADPLTNDLLAVTDTIIQNTRRRGIRKIYQSLRGSARRHVKDAVPAIAALIDEYAADP